MELLNTPRQCGKTTYLIKKAIQTNYSIIVGTQNQKDILKNKIKQITNKEIKVYTASEFIKNNNLYSENILIDELPSVLSNLLNTKVEMATMTSE